MRLAGATNTSYSGTFNGGSFNANGPYTLAFWALSATFPAVYYRIILSNAGGDLIRLRFDSAGGFGLVDSVGVTTNANMLASGAATSNQFDHWAATFDGSTFTLWRNGASVASASGTVSGRSAFDTIQIIHDGNASNDFGVYNLFLFDQALTREQIITVRNSAWPDVTQSSHVYGWWQLLGSSSTGVDRSQTKSDFTTGTPSTQFFQPQRRWADRSSWWHRLILPQYMLQPPIAHTVGNITNAPPALIGVSYPVASVAGATTNAPSATITAKAVIASTAAAVSNAPSSTITSAAPVASVAAATSNVPAVTLLNAPAVASVAAAVTNAPTAAVNPSYPIASVAGAVTNAGASVSTGAVIASVAAAVTNVPSANVTAGLGSTASSTTDAPAVTLQRNLPIISAAAATSNATAAIGASVPVASTAAAVTNAPASNITAKGVIASTAATASNCPAAAILASATVACVSSSVTNCPSAPLSAARVVASVASSVTNCPPANIVPLLFFSVSSVCATRSDCPTIAYQTFFKDVTAPPVQQRRVWPPRPR